MTRFAAFPSDRNLANDEVNPLAVQLPLRRSVYFDYDKSAIKDEYPSMLMAHAAYLRSHPDTTTEIQRNCY
jgi:peptidoglycan-associated lipoprotein